MSGVDCSTYKGEGSVVETAELGHLANTEGEDAGLGGRTEQLELVVLKDQSHFGEAQGLIKAPQENRRDSRLAEE